MAVTLTPDKLSSMLKISALLYVDKEVLPDLPPYKGHHGTDYTKRISVCQFNRDHLHGFVIFVTAITNSSLQAGFRARCALYLYGQRDTLAL